MGYAKQKTYLGVRGYGVVLVFHPYPYPYFLLLSNFSKIWFIVREHKCLTTITILCSTKNVTSRNRGNSFTLLLFSWLNQHVVFR